MNKVNFISTNQKFISSHYHLYLTSQCNQNCLFCLVKDKPDPNLSLLDLKKLLFNLKQKGVKNLSIDGGEPTLFKDFILLLQEIHKLRFSTVHLKTNGIKFTEQEFVKQFFQIQTPPQTTIFLSLHSHHPKIHDYLTNKKGSFHQVIKAINNISNNHGRLIINTVVCETNYRELDKFIDFLKKYNILEVNFLFIAPFGNALRNTYLIPDLNKVIPYCKNAIDIGLKNNVKISLTFFPFCVLGRYKKFAVEYNILTPLKYFSENYDYKNNFLECRQCKYYLKCPKIWTSYLKLHKFQPKKYSK